MQNKAGKYVEPTIASGQAALAAAKLPDDLIAWIPDPEGDDVVSDRHLHLDHRYKKYAEPKKAAALKEVLTYCLTDGQKDERGAGLYPLAERGGRKKTRRPWQHRRRGGGKEIPLTPCRSTGRSDGPIRPPESDARGSSDGRSGLDLAAAHPLGEIRRPGFSRPDLRRCLADGPVGPVHRGQDRPLGGPGHPPGGLGFLTANTWDPNKDQYGILPQIWGTLYSSVLAVMIGTVLGLAVAVFLSERLFPRSSFAS